MIDPSLPCFIHSIYSYSTTMFSNSLRRGLLSGSSTTRSGAAARRWMGGNMPVPQSQNAPLWGGHTVAKEGWEESVYFYYAAGIILQAAVILGAPETSIESWARPEAQARLRLAAQGQTEFEFGTHYQEVEKQASLEIWNKFADRSTIPGDDDDDDEDDEEEEEEEVNKLNVLFVFLFVRSLCTGHNSN